MVLRCLTILALLAVMFPCAAMSESVADVSPPETLSTRPFTPEEKDAQYRLLDLMMGGVVVSAGLGFVARRLLQNYHEGNA